MNLSSFSTPNKQAGKASLVLVGIISAIVVVMSIFLLRWTTAEQGEGIVFVKRPFFFGDSGVVQRIDTTGTYFHVPTTKGVIVNLTPVRKPMNFSDLATDDKIPLDFQVTVILQLDNAEGYKVVDKFVSLDQWYANNFEMPFGEIVRQGARERKGTDLMYDEIVIKDFAEYLRENARELIARDPDAKIILRDVVVGRGNPPEQLANQIAETARQKEREKTEAQRKLTEDTRAAAESSRAAADEAYRAKLGMTVDQYLISRQLDNQARQIEVTHKAVEDKVQGLEFIVSMGGTIQPVKAVGK
jgi:hypothetical protein